MMKSQASNRNRISKSILIEKRSSGRAKAGGAHSGDLEQPAHGSIHIETVADERQPLIAENGTVINVAALDMN